MSMKSKMMRLMENFKTGDEFNRWFNSKPQHERNSLIKQHFKTYPVYKKYNIK